MILGALELEKKLRTLSEMELRQGIEKGFPLSRRTQRPIARCTTAN